MASPRSGRKGDRSGFGGNNGSAKENVVDLQLRLNLTEEEEAVLEFSDDEGEAKPQLMERVVVGKVLSPSIMNMNSVHSAMKPA